MLALSGGIVAGGILGIPPSTFFHELGHVVALKLLFLDVEPKISVALNGEGSTSWGGPAEKLRFKRFTRDTCMGIMSAAGPIFDCINIFGSTIFASALSKTHPVLSIAFTSNACVQGVAMCHYAYMSDSHGDDYYDMSKIFKIPKNRFTIMTAIINLVSLTTFYVNVDAIAIQHPNFI